MTLGASVEVVGPLTGYNVGIVVGVSPDGATMNVRVFNHLNPALDQVVKMTRAPLPHGYLVDGWGWLREVP